MLLNDVPWIVRPALIDLHHVELKHYPFAISIDKCTGSCNVLIPKMCVPKETKDIQVRPKIAPYFAFHCKIVFYKSLAISFSWCRQHLERFFRHQYGSNWTLYYAAADKDYHGVLCNKISSSHTTAMQERFRQEQCTWQKDNSTFGGKILEDGKCGRCTQRSTSFIFWHNSWEYSKSKRMSYEILQKLNSPSLTRICYFKNISFEDPPWWR